MTISNINRLDQFKLDCKIINLKYEYTGYKDDVQWALVNQQLFKTYLVFGQMRVDVESFEEWYANQFHYKKVNGERPGRNYGHTITSTTIAKVLGISRATARDIVDRNSIEMMWVDGTRRVLEDSFEKWYASQSHYKKVMEIKEVERFVD